MSYKKLFERCMTYPREICRECGLKHGRRKPEHAHSVWQGDCDLCGKNTTVTSPRDYGHLKEGWDKNEASSDRKESNMLNLPILG